MSIAPGKVEYNFEPNMQLTLGFSVESPEIKIKIFSSGDLAEYVSFDKTELNGSGGFTATIKLPAEVEKPGTNNLYIMAQQIPGEGGGIATAVAVGALIKINVPYPGKYAEMSFSVEDVNVGEDLKFNSEISSLGKEDIFAIIMTNISVYNGNAIETFELGHDFIKPTEKKNFQKIVNSSKYGAGHYTAIAILNYGTNRTVKIEKPFKIGSLFVEILNYTKEVYSGKLSKFDIEIGSNWNNKIENIYAYVSVYDKKNETNVLTEFKTTSESIDRWQIKNLTAYLDATNIKPGIYKTNITLFYEKNSNTKIVEIVVKRKIPLNLIIIGVVVLIALAIVIIFAIVKIKKKKR